MSRPVTRLAGLVFSALHFAYHVTHLHVCETVDRWLNVVSQVGSILSPGRRRCC